MYTRNSLPHDNAHLPALFTNTNYCTFRIMKALKLPLWYRWFWSNWVYNYNGLYDSASRSWLQLSFPKSYILPIVCCGLKLNTT